jgi:xanthine dehydrogenase YagT iron-sulfur-binding subunit
MPENTEFSLSRRSLLHWASAAGTTAMTPGIAHSAPKSEKTYEPAGAQPVTLKINGKVHSLKLEPRVTILDCLRENLKLTGTKKGCDHGQCGACTIHINGQRVNSCLTLAVMHEGDEITTIEGLGSLQKLHPVQAAFVTHDAFQCGYCTAGQIMSGVALLKEKCGPADADVREAMSGNICRCGAYKNILSAIQEARGQSSGRS